LCGNKVSVSLVAPFRKYSSTNKGSMAVIWDKRLEIKIPVLWYFNHLNLPVFNHAVSRLSYL